MHQLTTIDYFIMPLIYFFGLLQVDEVGHQPVRLAGG